MRRNALLLIAVGCLVALAGCGGALSGEDEPTLDDVTYPDGVSENRTNVSALADAHAAELNGSSYTLALEMTQNGSAGNQSFEMDAAVSADREEVRANVSSMDRRTSLYLTGDRQYARLSSEGETVYDASDRAPAVTGFVSSSRSGAAYVEEFGASAGANFTPTAVRERNGATLLVLHADGSDVSAPDGVEIGEYDATILVDERGVVRGFEATVESERDGATETVSISMEISDVNETSVGEPPWLDEARKTSET